MPGSGTSAWAGAGPNSPLSPIMTTAANAIRFKTSSVPR